MLRLSNLISKAFFFTSENVSDEKILNNEEIWKEIQSELRNI